LLLSAPQCRRPARGTVLPIGSSDRSDRAPRTQPGIVLS
jgi:hypothetical protein